jgi:hypothetical protein
MYLICKCEQQNDYENDSIYELRSPIWFTFDKDMADSWTNDENKKNMYEYTIEYITYSQLPIENIRQYVQTPKDHKNLPYYYHVFTVQGVPPVSNYKKSHYEYEKEINSILLYKEEKEEIRNEHLSNSLNLVMENIKSKFNAFGIDKSDEEMEKVRNTLISKKIFSNDKMNDYFNKVLQNAFCT